MRLKPKSCAVLSAGISDDYGSIPNLRVPDEKIAKQLKYYKPGSPVPTRSYRPKKKIDKQTFYSM